MALQYLAQAFGAVLTPMNMGVLLLSTFAGLIMGMLPGLSATLSLIHISVPLAHLHVRG